MGRPPRELPPKEFSILPLKYNFDFRSNHEKDHVVERSQGGPKDKVAGASGIEIFHQEYQRVNININTLKSWVLVLPYKPYRLVLLSVRATIGCKSYRL